MEEAAACSVGVAVAADEAKEFVEVTCSLPPMLVLACRLDANLLAAEEAADWWRGTDGALLGAAVTAEAAELQVVVVDATGEDARAAELEKGGGAVLITAAAFADEGGACSGAVFPRPGFAGLHGFRIEIGFASLLFAGAPLPGLSIADDADGSAFATNLLKSPEIRLGDVRAATPPSGLEIAVTSLMDSPPSIPAGPPALAFLRLFNSISQGA